MRNDEGSFHGSFRIVENYMSGEPAPVKVPVTPLAIHNSLEGPWETSSLAILEPMGKALVAGTLISLTGFALVFWAVNSLLPLIPRLEASPLFQVVTDGIALLGVAMALLACRRKYRRDTRAAHR